MNKIFVFGSNLKGIHGAGQALYARQHHGAILGQGTGLQGNSYAIPTKKSPYEKMSLEEIKPYVDQFIVFAANHRGEPWSSFRLEFDVQRLGCGRAGFTDSEMARLFAGHPENVTLHYNFSW